MPLPVPMATCVSFLSYWRCHSLRSAFFHSLTGLPRFLRLQPSVVLYLLWELAAFFPGTLLWISGSQPSTHLNTQWAPQKHCLFHLTCVCSMTSLLPMKQWLELWFSSLYFRLNSLLAKVGVGRDMLFCLPTSCFSGQPPSLLRTYPEREITSLDLSSSGPHGQVNYPNKAVSKFSWDRSSEIDCGWPVGELGS